MTNLLTRGSPFKVCGYHCAAHHAFDADKESREDMYAEAWVAFKKEEMKYNARSEMQAVIEKLRGILEADGEGDDDEEA